ncbi:MAG: hypothetical protein ACE5GU_03265 [Candidatus Scalinduaceae bacterium]
MPIDSRSLPDGSWKTIVTQSATLVGMIGNLFYKIFITGLQEWQDKEGSKNPVNLVVEVYQKAGIY